MKKDYMIGMVIVGLLGVFGSFFWRSAAFPALIIIVFIMIKFGIFGENK